MIGIAISIWQAIVGGGVGAELGSAPGGGGGGTFPDNDTGASEFLIIF